MGELKSFQATILFEGYDNEQLRASGLPPLDQRIRECIETHPVASFKIDSVQVEEKSERRRDMRLLFALKQVAFAYHLEGPTDRVLKAFGMVSKACGDENDSRTTVSSPDALPPTEARITGHLAQARHFVEKK